MSKIYILMDFVKNTWVGPYKVIQFYLEHMCNQLQEKAIVDMVRGRREHADDGGQWASQRATGRSGLDYSAVSQH
jgi:hypothetical protein